MCNNCVHKTWDIAFGERQKKLVEKEKEEDILFKASTVDVVRITSQSPLASHFWLQGRLGR